MGSLDLLPPDYWWMLAAGVFVLADHFFPRKGISLIALAAVMTSGLILVGAIFERGAQVGVFVALLVFAFAARFIWRHTLGAKQSAMGFADILEIHGDGSLLVEYEKVVWPAILLQGEPRLGERIGVKAVGNGVLWCRKI
jgi:membrane protein implicated in regulation of membrane protease activity